MVRRLWAFEAEPTVPLHGDNTTVGSNVDDRAARSVKKFSPFYYLTDMEVQHRLLLGWRMAHTTINAGSQRGDTGGVTSQIHLGLDAKSVGTGRGAGRRRVTRTSRRASFS